MQDLLGHGELLAKLQSAADRDQLHHALLFEGPDGIGRALVAMRLAQYVNCEQEDRPCGVCRSCKTIASGNHPDVLWLRPEEGKRFIRVDQVRKMVRTVGYSRYGAARRFLIIDGVERMPASAANALLKTLEEPPDGTGFVLLAGHRRALLPTIVSRCQVFRFRPVPTDTLSAWLTARGVENAPAVARAADGVPGRALRLADGGLAARGEAMDLALNALGADLKGIFDMATKLTKGAREDVTERVEAVFQAVEDLLRDATVHGAGSGGALRRPGQAGVSKAWAAALYPAGIQRNAARLATARRRVGGYVNARMVVESLIVELATDLGRARKAR